jgi:predicted Rossmann fold nucleotide-binding protein DprA/Smf involved in DNA uptake
MVESARDVLEELRLDAAGLTQAAGELPNDPVLAAMTPGEAYELAGLCAACGLNASRMLSRLAELELTGWVQRSPGGRFVRSRGNVLR